MPAHITYDQLLEVISLGLIRKTVKRTSLTNCDNIKLIKGAICNGKYIGSPARDIFFMLPYLTDEQMKEVAKKFAKEFPKKIPGNHVNVSSCIRCIYGQFEKQGTLKSEKDFGRMKEEKPDWKLPRKFLQLLKKEFKKNKNYYGLTVLSEMEAHRLGDNARLEKDSQKLIEMEKKYLDSVKFAHKCKSYKHMFTPYYWAGCYFKEFGQKNKAIKYFKKTIKEANKYANKYSRVNKAYISRYADCLKFIKKEESSNWKKYCSKYSKEHIKSRVVRGAFKKAR